MTLRRRSFRNSTLALRSVFQRPKKAKTSRTTRRTRGKRAGNNDDARMMNGEGMPESKCAIEGGTCSLTGSDFEDVDFFRIRLSIRILSRPRLPRLWSDAGLTPA